MKLKVGWGQIPLLHLTLTWQLQLVGGSAILSTEGLEGRPESVMGLPQNLRM